VIVTLKREVPEVRSFLINSEAPEAAQIEEESISELI
jgi:hypothetical protein